MSHLEPPPPPRPSPTPPQDSRREQPSPAARRVSRIALAASVILGLGFVGTFFIDSLPLPVRSWIAEVIPGGHQLVGLPPDPEAEIEMLIDRMGLTEEGRRVFLLAQPVVVDDLGELCGTDDDATLVTLGCYHGIDRIFVLRGGGPYGDAVTVTTAAHELLHAIYARMPVAERERLEPLLAAEMARILPDDPVLEQIDASVGDDESNRANEQFAYLGAQVALPGGFSDELERVYAQWFADRQALARAAP